MGIGVVALVVQVQIPAVLRSGIDGALGADAKPLSHFVWLLLALAVARFVTGALYRYLLFRAGYLFETDLRAIVYEHLTRLSFSYFDRTLKGGFGVMFDDLLAAVATIASMLALRSFFPGGAA